MANELNVSYVADVNTETAGWGASLDAAKLDLSGAPGTSVFFWAVPTTDPKVFKAGKCEVTNEMLVKLIQESARMELISMGADFNYYKDFQTNGKYDCPTAKVMSLYAAYIRGTLVTNDGWIAGPEDLQVLLARSAAFQAAVIDVFRKTGAWMPEGLQMIATPLIYRGHATVVAPNLGSCGLKNLGNGITQPPPDEFKPEGYEKVGYDVSKGESNWMLYAGVAAVAGVAGLGVWALRKRARRS
jgi:hypothetical protein